MRSSICTRSTSTPCFAIGERDARGIIRKLRARGGPSDVAAQQAKVARAEALVFISPVEHVYFYAVHGADDATRREYLRRAYALGRNFARSESVTAESHA